MDMLKGMNDALAYIEQNLSNHIELKEVAKIGMFSEYHFTRMFSLLSGITISEYIRRRRLTVAALELKNPHVKVIDVAVKYGYQSPDAFSRAFQSYHGVTPTVARETEQSLKAYPRMSFQLSIEGGIEMNYRIVEKEAFQVIGVNYEVKMNGDELTPSYEKMLTDISEETMNELASLSTQAPHGVVHATANYQEGADGQATFDQYIGAATKVGDVSSYATLEVPKHLWVVFEVEGEWAAVEEQWQRIYTEWLPSSSYELAEGPEILSSQDNKSEIWVSIKEK
ncbi:AraC family transcriptional regulator [Paenalkalicoccus suaedae]|uniref:AraC family transcriptional regulator n=1 Tax=Paenalkalicoccus suaedae TaxID=2592382 RepID=A0A859FJR5_9BACI|nr:GyrI-like domain-containing protein [Paenalkalicoccus suaedae]QKS73044.1 AraC family transcriptional regulator [Paenalkalicoccus suaedae]